MGRFRKKGKVCEGEGRMAADPPSMAENDDDDDGDSDVAFFFNFLWGFIMRVLS